MEVFSMIKHSLVTDDINPITKYFRLGAHVASGGPELAWKIYQAVRIEDGKEASVFMFDKKIAEKLHKPRRRELMTELLRKEARYLARLRHQRILRVIRPLEECNDSIAFATEPVLASLANLLGHQDRLPASAQAELKDHSFLDVEIKYGILQIAEALSYLHTTERVLHMNVCPHSVFITRRGGWKLAGFAFSQCSKDEGMKQDMFPARPCCGKQPRMTQPDMDYIAPEIQLETSKYATTSSDIFSLGMVICALHNHGQSLIHAQHNPALYNKQVEKMTELFSDVAQRLPIELVEPTEKMINKDIRYRPTAQLFMLLKYFDDPVVRCIQSLDIIENSREVSTSAEYYNHLTQVIPLCHRLIKSDHVTLVLPPLLTLIEQCSEEDYRSHVQLQLRLFLTSTNRPIQATVYLLQHISVVLSKASDDEIRTDVLPMIFSTHESNSIPGQEAALHVFSTIRKYVDDQTMRKLILPKAKALFIKSTSIQTRLNALECIDRLIDSLDKMMILEEVLPFLTDIQCSDVDIIMSLTAIYNHLLSDRSFGLTHSLLATKVMPTLIPYTATPGLNMQQFGELMSVLYEMLNQIDIQRRNKMISEAPDNKALELRRTSMDMRFSSVDSPHGMIRGGASDLGHASSSVNNLRVTGPQLTVDESYVYKHRTSSAPGTSRELSSSLGGVSQLSVNHNNSSYRRHSSFQCHVTPDTSGSNHSTGLNGGAPHPHPSHPMSRKDSVRSHHSGYSVTPPCTPHILVSEASVSDFKDLFAWGPGNRRASSQSVGAVIDPLRRNSRELLDKIPIPARRPSFQGICESAMQLFK